MPMCALLPFPDWMMIRLEADRRRHAELLTTHVVHYQDGDAHNGSVVLGPRIAPTAEDLRFDGDRGL